MDADRNTVYKRILKLSWNDSQGSCRDDSDEEMINSLHELHYLKHLIDMIIVDLESSTQVSVLEMVLTSVGYILSGIWVQNSDISPLVSLKPSDALAESIIKLTQHTELRIRLLAVFVISNQATPSFFSNHVPRIMHELSGILMQSESIKSKSRVSLEDVCFSQCISALVCMRDQFPHCIAKYLSLDLIEGLFEWLIAAMSSETPDQHYSDDHILLLKDVSSIIRLCSYTLALHLLVRAHSTLPVLSEAIK